MFQKFCIFCTLLALGHYNKIDAQGIIDPYTYSKYVVSIADLGSIANSENSKLGDAHICAGIIIGRQTILTAAHCVTNVQPEQLRIVTGAPKRKNHTESAQVFLPNEIIIHPKYESGDVSTFDIAIVKLRDHIIEDDSTAKLSELPSRTYARPGDICTHVGWGRVSDDGDMADEIQNVDLIILEKSFCEKKIANLEDTYCAGEPARGGKMSCRSDSGGPLFCKGHFAGIAVFTIKCHKIGPTYFTEIAKHLDWINEHSFDNLNFNFRSSSGNKLQIADNIYSHISNILMFAIKFLFD